MKTATVADLRNDFAMVSTWLYDGVAVTITKRGRPFAVLSPLKKRKAANPIDRMARLRRMFPEGPVVASSSVIDYDRGDT